LTTIHSVSDYLLFIDTEASGLPVNWTLPYESEGNWPSAVQVSWLVYTANRKEVKREDHYILNKDFFITPEAMNFHGINPGFLAVNGKDRNAVMNMLAADLERFKPMVIGHYLQLDYHILGADFYRVGLHNPLVNLPVFCTMLATLNLVWTPMQKSMRLGELYAYLFQHELQDQHNAIVDAHATAECYFELRKRGEVTEKSIAEQQKHAGIKNLRTKPVKLF
jgi:DNA polymerase-3 subunit epsilon